MLLEPPSRPRARRRTALLGLLLLAACIPESRFAADVPVPRCDASDPEVRILSRPADLGQLNDPSARIFCLEPGDYRAYGTVRIEVSGAEGAERHLRYFDPEQPGAIAHPIDQAPRRRAVLKRLVLAESDRWVIQGVTIEGDSDTPGSHLSGASHNILSSLLVQHGWGALLRISESPTRVSRENVVQRSVIRRAAITPSDNNCLSLTAPASGRPMPGNRFVENEIYDCTDAIQVVAFPDEQPGPLPGTVIADNDLYLTADRYADAEGNRSPDGDWACAEEILDLKQGGTASAPMRVIGNRIWGMRRASPECGQQGGWGTLVNQKLHAAHVFYEGNILSGGPRGFTIGGAGRAVLLRNVVHDIRDPTDALAHGLLLRASGNEVFFNTLSDVSDDWLSAKAADTRFECNVLANAEDTLLSYPEYSFWADYNAFYDSEPVPYRGLHDLEGSVEASGLEARCFARRRYTGPEMVCIPNARATEASPHAGACHSAGEAVYRCEASDGDPTDVACAGPGDASACAGTGTGACKAYPGSWFD